MTKTDPIAEDRLLAAKWLQKQIWGKRSLTLTSLQVRQLVQLLRAKPHVGRPRDAQVQQRDIEIATLFILERDEELRREGKLGRGWTAFVVGILAGLYQVDEKTVRRAIKRHARMFANWRP